MPSRQLEPSGKEESFTYAGKENQTETISQQQTAALAFGNYRGDVKDQAAHLQRATNGRLSRAGNTLLQLQNQFGNRYVQRLINPQQRLTVQPKLMLGDVATPSEREADQIANEAMRGNLIKTAPTPVKGLGTAVFPQTESAINQAKGSGQPLPEKTRTHMEQNLGTDLSRVRLHTDSRAHSLNQSLQAKAFTTGQDIFFRQGAYNPGNSTGQTLLAHELTHVMQQTQQKPLPHPNGPLIQRKIFLGKQKPFQEVNQQEINEEKVEGKGDRKIAEMATDDQNRYFDNYEEMLQYAQEETDYIGLHSDGQWIRVEEKGTLYVLGEYHGESDDTFSIVKALGTRRFMHEGYTEAPPQYKKESELEQQMKVRKSKLTQKINDDVEEQLDVFPHEAEDFFPKVCRALWGVGSKQPESTGPIVDMYLNWALLYTKQHDPNYYSKKEKDLQAFFKAFKKYGNWEDRWNDENSEDFQDLPGYDTFVKFRKDFVSHAKSKTKKSFEKSFKQKWSLAKKDEYTLSEKHNMMLAEKYRDRSMYEYMKKGQQKGYLIYGLGMKHYYRLEALVKATQNLEGNSTEHFLERQGEKYPK